MTHDCEYLYRKGVGENETKYLGDSLKVNEILRKIILTYNKIVEEQALKLIKQEQIFSFYRFR